MGRYMANFLRRHLKVLVLILSYAQPHVEASPTPRTSKPLKGTLSLITILILVSLFLLLFTVKCMFVSHRRRKRDVNQARKYSAPRVWRDDLSISSVNLHRDSAGNTTEKDAKSPFLVGLLGSPAWETRPLAEVGISFGPLLLNRSLSPGAIKGSSKLGCGQKRYGLFPHRTPHWHPLESTSKGPKGLSKCKNLVAIPFTTYRGKGLSRNDEGPRDPSFWQSSARHSELSTLHHSSQEGLESLELDSPISSHQSPTNSLALPQPALVLPCPGPSIAPRVVKREADHILHIDPVNHPLACSSLKTTGKDVEGLLSKCHPVLLNSSISLPALLPQPDIISRTLSEGNVYFHAPSHPYSVDSAIFQASGAPASISPLTRDRFRFSPIIRPSPLRNMYLPSEDESSMGSFQDLDGHEPSLDHQTNGSGEDDLAHLLPPLSPSASPTIRHDLVTTEGNEQSSPKLRSRPSRKDQSDNLMMFLEELVQATSAWDDSLFLDSNFKAMIDSSKPASSSLPVFRLKKSRLTRKRQMSFVFLEDIPEVDVTDCEIAPAEEVMRGSSLHSGAEGG